MKKGDYFGEWSEHVKSWIFNPIFDGSIHLVRYEDLILEPFDAMVKMLSFSNVKVKEKELDRAIFDSSSDSMKESERTHRTNSIEHKDVVNDDFTFVRKASFGDWKNYYSSQMNNKFYEKYGHLMNELGYKYE